MSQIIELCGNFGVGKSFIAKYIIGKLVNRGRPLLYSPFSASIKSIMRKAGVNKECTLKTKDTFEEFYDIIEDEIFTLSDKLKLRPSDTSDVLNRNRNQMRALYSGYKLHKSKESARRLMQVIGTDIAREIDGDFWIDVKVNELLPVLNNIEDIVILIDDYRFPNEDLTKYGNEKFHKLVDDIKLIKIECDMNTLSKRLNMSVNEIVKIRNHPSEKMIGKLHYELGIDTNGNLIDYNAIDGYLGL